MTDNLDSPPCETGVPWRFQLTGRWRSKFATAPEFGAELTKNLCFTKP